MNVLRTVNGIQLNQGDEMAKGLYNVSQGEKAERLSFWFDEETKDELLAFSDDDFETKSNELIDASYPRLN